MRRKKKIKKLERKLKYCFDLLINLSITVANLQKEKVKVDDNTLNNNLNIVYTIVK